MRRVIAKLIGFHGIKGELKLYPLVDDISVFEQFSKLYIGGAEYDLLSWREHKSMVLVMVAGIIDLTHAEKLFNPKSQEILVEANLKEDLNPGEHYIEDLKGMAVMDSESGELIGEVKTCTEGLQTVLVVRLAAANKELLIPFVDEYIIEIDAASRTIRARISSDLLELAS